MSNVIPPPRRLAPEGPSSTAVFLALRRMRAPLIVLIVLFAVSIVGLILIPGVDNDGQPYRMTLFDAFYFMTYTAPTIGFGELPYPFTTGQRAWVSLTIYSSVFAWAYAIATLLSLLQDRGFREAIGLQSFERRVRHLREPFLLVIGFGQAGEVLARFWDSLDRRLVVIDVDQERIDALNLAAFQSDVPGLVADARNPHDLIRAGLLNPHCVGVVALTEDDEANLAVVMSAHLLRPGIPVAARAHDREITHRMAIFGDPEVINPLDLFGDELMLAVTSPQRYRLGQWLTSGPQAELSQPLSAPGDGRWVVAGHGDFGRYFTADLLKYGQRVTIIDRHVAKVPGASVVLGDCTDPAVLRRCGLDQATGFVAATRNDTTNLSALAEAGKINPNMFLVGRQNRPVDGPLFESANADAVLVPTQLVAHEVMARIGTPMAWRFAQEAATQSEEWATELLAELTAAMGTRLQELWVMDLTPTMCEALVPQLHRGIGIRDVLHDPDERERALDIVPLLLERGEQQFLWPLNELDLRIGDQILMAGTASDRRRLDKVVTFPPALEYVLSGHRVGNSWIWRTVAERVQHTSR